MKLILILTSFLLFSSCLRSKYESQTVFEMTDMDLETLKSECSEINLNGSILRLLKEVKSESRAVFNILENSNPEDHVGKITLLTNSVSEKSKKIISLAREDWTTPQWHQELRWEIDEFDLGNRLTRMGLSIQGQFVDSIYLQGEKRDDLKGSIQLNFSNNKVHVSFRHIGSSLELCQLQETMSIIVGVKFRSLGITKTQYFNLYVKNELSRSL